MSDYTSPQPSPSVEGEKRSDAATHQNTKSPKHQNTMGIALTLLGALCLLASIWYTSAQVVAQSDYNCSAPYRVDETLPTGARWEWCWEQRFNEGVILHDIYFTPPGGPRRLVIATASLAQVHVPYDDNGGRFHDVSDFGLGSQFLLTLSQSECPNGLLIPWGGRNVICKQVEQRGYAQKYYSRELQGWQISFWSIGSSGDYNYINQWNFNDDGSIVPTVGAAGKLQRYGQDEQYGWRTRPDKVPISHYHNYWYKLDFDIDGLANDLVQEIQFNPADNNRRRVISVAPIFTEAARDHAPDVQRSWRVLDTVSTNGDGRPISYQIEAMDSGHQFNGPDFEPFSFHDIYITRARACERYASHNPTAGGCASDASTFVNGEDVNGQDVVIWYGITFHHLPRDEEEGYMAVHWSSFTISPRDWTSTNPLDARQNQGPTLTPTSTLAPATETPTGTPTQTPTATQDAAACTNLLANPGFEQTGNWSFGATPFPAAYVTSPVYSGTRAVRLGITKPEENVLAFSSAYQLVDLPATDGVLRLSYWERTQRIGADDGADYREALLLNADFAVLRALNRSSAVESGWHLRTFDLTSYAGQRVALYFNVYNNGAGGVLSNVIDDVSLALCDDHAADAGLEVKPQFVTLLDTDLPITLPITISAVAPSAPLNWQAVESTAWLTVSTTSGTTPGVVTLNIGAVGGSEVASTGTITFTASEPYHSNATVQVTVLRGLDERMYLPAVQH